MLVRRRLRDIRPFAYDTFCKTTIDRNYKKACLIFPEIDQSPKANLRMFKLDNKLI